MRETADITKVSKRGAIYTIHGVSKGKQASFHVAAPSFEAMSHKDAEAFMKRNIANIAKHEE